MQTCVVLLFSLLYGAHCLQWQIISPGGTQPRARYGASTSMYTPTGFGARILMCGGQGPVIAYDDCYLAVPSAQLNEWQYIQTVPSNRIYPRAKQVQVTTMDNAYIVMYGGNTSSFLPDTPEIIAPGPWGPTTPTINGDVPTARYGHSAVLSANNMQLIIFGGSSFENDSELNDVAVLDLSQAGTKVYTWSAPATRGVDMPSPRRYHTAVAYNNKMYVYGGQRDTTVFEDLYILGLSGSAQWLWQRQDVVNAYPLYGHRSAIIDSTLYLIGGLTSQGAPTPAESTGGVLAIDMSTWNIKFLDVDGAPPNTWFLGALTPIADPTAAENTVLTYFGGSSKQDGGSISSNLFILSGFAQPVSEPSKTVVYVIAACTVSIFVLISVAVLGWWRRRSWWTKRSSNAAYLPFTSQAPGVPVGTFSYAYGTMASGYNNGYNTGYNMPRPYAMSVEGTQAEDVDEGSRLQLR